MKQTIKSLNYFYFGLTLCAMILSGCSCSAPKRVPDPLAAFHVSDVKNLDSNKAITDDYKAYIQTLSPEEKQRLGPYPASFFEDGTGQHAVLIRIGINGTEWEHVLIYDKNDKRIKTIKYASGRYSS